MIVCLSRICQSDITDVNITYIRDQCSCFYHACYLITDIIACKDQRQNLRINNVIRNSKLKPLHFKISICTPNIDPGEHMSLISGFTSPSRISLPILHAIGFCCVSIKPLTHGVSVMPTMAISKTVNKNMHFHSYSQPHAK